MARHGKTPLRIACRVMASHRVTRHGFALHVMPWPRVVLHGKTWRNVARHGLVLDGMAFPGFPLFPGRFALLPAVPLVSGMHFRG